MIKIEKPSYDVEIVFNDCLPTYSKEDKSAERLQRIKAYKEDIVRESEDYDSKASTAELYKIRPIDDHDNSHKQLKADMAYLYKDRFHLANKGNYYSSMRFKTTDFCPYCGREFSTATPELDHFLPKACYPLLSVTPTNLVPACSDCNNLKRGNALHSQNEQMFHPYYEDLSKDIWIKAEVIPNESEQLAFIFKVDCPTDWPDVMKERAINQFNKLKLAERYPSMVSLLSSDTLKGIKHLYRQLGPVTGKELAQDYIEQMLNNRDYHKNHYKLVMLRALKENKWFWDKFMTAQMRKDVTGNDNNNNKNIK